METFLSNPLSYLCFFFPFQRAANKLLLAGNRSSETATVQCLSGHVTTFYNLWDMLISRCFTGGIDLQIMTLFLVKSTLVSCCVCTCDIVCLISRITVSSAYFCILSSTRGLWAHFERDSPFIFWRNTPAAVMSDCVDTADLWEHTWDDWEIYSQNLHSWHYEFGNITVLLTQLWAQERIM